VFSLLVTEQHSSFAQRRGISANYKEEDMEQIEIMDEALPILKSGIVLK